MKTLLMNTYSKEYFDRVCSALKENNIRYSVKVQDINNRYGLFGLDSATRPSVPAKEKNQYRVYVPDKEYAKAEEILEGIQR